MRRHFVLGVPFFPFPCFNSSFSSSGGTLNLLTRDILYHLYVVLALLIALNISSSMSRMSCANSADREDKFASGIGNSLPLLAVLAFIYSVSSIVKSIVYGTPCAP